MKKQFFGYFCWHVVGVFVHCVKTFIDAKPAGKYVFWSENFWKGFREEKKRPGNRVRIIFDTYEIPRIPSTLLHEIWAVHYIMSICFLQHSFISR